jgi:peroxiredoxin Q/BCP
MIRSIKASNIPENTKKVIRRVRSLLLTGQEAPDFITKDAYGNAVNLTDLKKDYVLVAFMRYAGCPYCNLAIHRLSVEYDMLQQNGCDVVVFVQSNPDEIIKNIYGRHKLRPPFPIIADMAKQFYDMYGVKSSKTAFIKQISILPYWLESVGKHGFKQGKLEGDHFLVPAMFLIRTKDRQIMTVKYGTSFYDHETFTHLYETLNFGEPLE